MTRPTLTAELQQFLYTHAPTMAYKKDLMQIVAKWETAYVSRIEELENQASTKASSRMIDEGGPSKKHGGYPDDDDDRFGNHY